jgi:hypothetical protein
MNKEMTVRPFEFGKDYPEICEWWRARKWPFLTKEMLSDYGLIAESDGIKYCAGWLLVPQSGKMGSLEWIISNPGSPMRRRKESIEALVEGALKVAKGIGLKTVFSALSNENLINIYQSRGFTVTDKNMTNLIARV